MNLSFINYLYIMYLTNLFYMRYSFIFYFYVLKSFKYYENCFFREIFCIF